MEIHAPDRHVQSPREIILHLAIVTAGILIALGLEQTVEWYRHRELAAEARETILNEIRLNKKELDTQIAQPIRSMFLSSSPTCSIAARVIDELDLRSYFRDANGRPVEPIL